MPFLTLSPHHPQAPHFPPGSDLLLKAASIYHSFLTWPVPYCDIFRELLTFISNELKAPGKRSCLGVGFPCAACSRDSPGVAASYPTCSMNPLSVVSTFTSCIPKLQLFQEVRTSALHLVDGLPGGAAHGETRFLWRSRAGLCFWWLPRVQGSGSILGTLSSKPV